MIHTKTTDQLFDYLRASNCSWGIQELMRLVELAESSTHRNVQLNLKRDVDPNNEPMIYPTDSEGRPCHASGEVIDFS